MRGDSYHSSILISRIHNQRHRQNRSNGGTEVKSHRVHVIQSFHVIKMKPPIEDHEIPDIDNTSSMACEHQIRLRPFVPGTFVESASGDHFIAFGADVLFKE
jgi:hypothetical protein